jgi:hypothetical protein
MDVAVGGTGVGGTGVGVGGSVGGGTAVGVTATVGFAVGVAVALAPQALTLRTKMIKPSTNKMLRVFIEILLDGIDMPVVLLPVNGCS